MTEQTREKIHQAFISLLQSRDYNDITVREIAEHAGIGFKTFYRHYHDKHHLTESMYRQVWHNFSERVALASPVGADSETNVRELLQTIQDNAHLMRAILAMYPQTNLLFDLAKGFGQAQIRQFKPGAFAGDDAPEPPLLDALNTHFVCGQIWLVKWWVDNDFPFSAETMTRLILKLVVEPIIMLEAPADLLDEPERE